MFLLLAYAFPSIWLGFLVAVWMRQLVGVGLEYLPAGILMGMSDAATFPLLAGVVLALVGHTIMQGEILYNKNFPKNLDAVGVYVGTVLVLGAFVISPSWYQWFGLLIATVFISGHCGIILFRSMLKWTRTAGGSVLILLILFGFLAVSTVLTWSYI